MFANFIYINLYTINDWWSTIIHPMYVPYLSFFIHLLFFLPLSVHLNNCEFALLHVHQVSSQDYVLILYGKDHIQSDVVTVQRLEFAHLNCKQFFSFFSQRKKIRCRQISWTRKPHVKSKSTFYPQWSKLFV